MTDFGFSNLNNLVRATQQSKENTETDKTVNKKEDNSKTDGVKDRQALAGAKQAEGKLRKEELPKTLERYKSFKSAYQYQLGEQPYEEEEVDNEKAKAKKLEKKEETQEPLKATLEEIEKYIEPRNKFKSKLQYFLGDDFNEEELYQEENLTPSEKIEDFKEKFKLANEAYNTLIEYISNFLGKFSFDNIENLKDFLEEGMPEDAIIKFISIHQLCNSRINFPNTMDLSIIIDKLNNLNIKISIDDLNKSINHDYETTKKLKYTVASFIYIPLQEVMNNLIKSSRIKLINYFNKLVDKYSFNKIEEFNGKIDEELINAISNLSRNYYSKIIEIYNEKNIINNKVMKQKLISENDISNINKINSELFNNLEEIKNFEIDISKIIYLYFYLNSYKNILDYNIEIPVNNIRNILLYCRVNPEYEYIENIINQNIKYNIFFNETSKEKKIQVQTDFFDNKLKASIIDMENKNHQKQTEFIKKTKLDDLDNQSVIFWYKQKYLKDFKENFIKLVN